MFCGQTMCMCIWVRLTYLRVYKYARRLTRKHSIPIRWSVLWYAFTFKHVHKVSICVRFGATIQRKQRACKRDKEWKESERMNEWASGWFRLPLTTKLCYECRRYISVFHFVLSLKQHSVFSVAFPFIFVQKQKRKKTFPHSRTFVYLCCFFYDFWFILVICLIFIIYPLEIIGICVLKFDTNEIWRESRMSPHLLMV